MSGYQRCLFYIFVLNDLIITTFELKKVLMHRIAEINDKSFLSAINTIIETKSNSTINNTTPEQRKRIMEGKAQI